MTPRPTVELIAELRSGDRLPFCPYDRRSPEYWTASDDKPCKVCGTLNDSSAPDLCNGTGSRIMGEAASQLQSILKAWERYNSHPSEGIHELESAITGSTEGRAG